MARPERAWREVEWLLLVLLVLGVYFSRLTDLTIRGEESRWARVAQEMLDTDDWLVPRQQGEPFCDRPPLNSWLMLAASRLTGELNVLTIRLPTALATLLTTLVIYAYGRNFLSRVGALAAAAAYATMGQVLQLGRLAESDALLTLFVTAALFTWHHGYARRRDPRLAWLCGYGLAALAALAKGPQGPVYLVAITTVFLVLRRDWRFLFCRWHLAGVALFLAIIGTWQVPLAMSLGPSEALRVWTEGGNLATRLQPASLPKALEHWATFPLELLGCMVPWSFLLPAVATRWFRENLGQARPLVSFVAVACAVALPSCWLPPDSRTRYFMSLYPCAALLIGTVIQLSWESRQADWWQRSWDQFLLTGMAMILGAPLLLGWLHFVAGPRVHGVGEAVSLSFVAIYAIAALAVAAIAAWSRRRRERWHVQLGVLSLAGFLGFTYTSIAISAQARSSNDPSGAIAEVRRMLLHDEPLVSFGPVHHLFAYYYRQPIALEPLEGHTAPSRTSATYFCFSEDPGFVKPEIPFAWERVAEISCERARSATPRAKVVIGRRISSATAASGSPAKGPLVIAAGHSAATSTSRR